MSGLGCEGILFAQNWRSLRKGQIWGENQALGPSLFGAGSQLGALMEPDGPLGEARMGEWASNHTPWRECWGGEGAFGSSTGRRTLRGSGQASEEVTAQRPGG